MKIYFAGPLFSLAERAFNSKLVGILREKYNYEIFLPQESKENKNSDTMSIFLSDEKGVKDCDVIVAVIDGADADSGTCWEFGFAYALGKKLIIIRTGFRVLERWNSFQRPINLMMYESAIKSGGRVIEYYGKNFDELATLIKEKLENK